MSEPTGDGNQKHPDGQPRPDQGQSEQTAEFSGSVFSDPTAPVWADPTAPIHAPRAPEVPYSPTQDTPPAPPVPPAPVAPPAPPGAAYNPYGQQPSSTSPPAPPMSNPYAQVPTTGQYGQPQPGQQYPAYGQPAGQYGPSQSRQEYPAYGQQPYATGANTETNVSAVILTIVSGLSMLFSVFTVGIPSLIFAIMALTSNGTDPVGSRKKAKTGWIIYAINAVLILLVFIIGVVALVALRNDPASSFDSGF